MNDEHRGKEATMSRDSVVAKLNNKNGGNESLAYVHVTYMVTMVTPPLGACHYCQLCTALAIETSDAASFDQSTSSFKYSKQSAETPETP
ncbi:hypothetical protein K443DRAFT_288948 [Laccaria amethystina LaAM-08-1]|uniref:Unplaced genomic scaffold K443scaffold_19, whole genome shotgun sequence n=1 Tax=Laccaria amethystina LaAM-08-1 TaxID=1095629 RepID=A0A0C9YDE9_9AGAR|nr:hypothetical protein K443DRAFT_288948 [Laccaria amethystina LaAM-08-1]